MPQEELIILAKININILGIYMLFYKLILHILQYLPFERLFCVMIGAIVVLGNHYSHLSTIYIKHILKYGERFVCFPFRICHR